MIIIIIIIIINNINNIFNTLLLKNMNSTIYMFKASPLKVVSSLSCQSALRWNLGLKNEECLFAK